MKLPTWTRTESTQRWCEELSGGEPGKIGPRGEECTETIVTYQCDDPSEEVFRQKCVMYGFSLPQFDTWLQELEPCGARDRLLTLRARAKASNQALQEAIADARYIWRGIIREDNLIGGALRVKARPSNGGKKSAEAKQQARDERKAAAVAYFRSHWFPGSERGTDAVIADMVFHKLGAEKTIRSVYLIDELRKARGKPVK